LRAGELDEGEAQYIWKMFNVHKIKMREPPELDIPAEQSNTIGDLVSLHMQDLGYSIGDLATLMCMNADEVSKTYSIALPGQDKGKPAHLRVIK
jgi:hypothetical protein